ERQVEFYQRMRELGLHGEAAQGFAAFANGMSRITTTGYCEEDFGKLSMRQQIQVNRRAAYNFTRIYSPGQATSNIPVVQWSPDENAPNMLPLDEHAAEYEAYLATVLGYGFDGKAYQRLAWDGPKSEAAVRRWIGFWKKYRAFFDDGYLLHVREPNGQKADAILHILEESGQKRGLLVAYNPMETEQAAQFDLPLEAAGWAPSDGQAVFENGKVLSFDENRIEITIPPFNATWAELD
ncbi:hypothetical protein P4B35_23885, partial [Pontiellaceae bacterium B12227]|nr:hypothetical protein [Pontiellaceae bacterium B12227]